MKHLKIFYSAFVIAGVLSLVGYTIIKPTKQTAGKEAQKAPFYGQAQNYYPINLNEAISIQALPDGRYVALMPVQGGAAWFVVGEPVVAQTNFAPMTNNR